MIRNRIQKRHSSSMGKWPRWAQHPSKDIPESTKAGLTLHLHLLFLCNSSTLHHRPKTLPKKTHKTRKGPCCQQPSQSATSRFIFHTWAAQPGCIITQCVQYVTAPWPSFALGCDKTLRDDFSKVRWKLLKQKEVPLNLATSYLSYNFLTDRSTNQLLSAVYSTVSRLTR